MKNRSTLARITMLLALASAPSCAGSLGTRGIDTIPTASEARRLGPTSTDGDQIGQWLISELISPNADAKRAQRARERLAANKSFGLYASLARAMDAEAHGHPRQANDSYMALLRAAQSSADELAPLAAWYAASKLFSSQFRQVTFWKKVHDDVRLLIDRPGNIGWRARAVLVQWWGFEQRRQSKPNVMEEVAKLHGCATHVVLAGPFGHGQPSARWTKFPAEHPGRWPESFPVDPKRPNVIPRQLQTERYGCSTTARNGVESGIFYTQTFFDLKQPRDVLLSVEGARAILVDDVTVVTRDPRQWGSWVNFGVLLRLSPGRHRVVARLPSPRVVIRIQNPDGTPVGVDTSTDDAPPYVTARPKVLGNPNVLGRFVDDGEVIRPTDDITTFLAAAMAANEGVGDVASVLMEPLVKKLEHAGPLALQQQASILPQDPAFPSDAAENLSRELYQREANIDPDAWRSLVWLVVDEAKKSGMSTTAKKLEQLMERFPNEPSIGLQLRRMYGQLGWTAQQTALSKLMAERFPENIGVLTHAMHTYEQEGAFKKADELAERIQHLDPDSEILVDRALAQGNYQSAIDELKKFAERHPDRKLISDRIQRLLVRAGLKQQSLRALEKQLARDPKSDSARLALADARYARGDLNALREAIADALEKGASTQALDNALEVLEGRTELAPYRIDGKRVIAEYEKSAKKMDAPAVRILDYGVTWVRRDGSARMLEHEIIKVQSQGAVGKLAEQPVPRSGLLLRVRVIKKDGRVMEPEFVQGKPTLTMPHLEIGDYIETEWITNMPGDWRHGGRSYVGPHWFFREQDIAYWRSEFVVITPKDRTLQVETQGDVPAAEVTEDGPLVIHRWRVDHSEAAVQEPGSVSVRERLPNVRIGWGISLRTRLDNLVDSFEDTSVADPRLKRIAQGIVRGIPSSNTAERARKVYRWLLANVQRGGEQDGRRVVVGRNGQLVWGFLYLTKLLGIETEIAVVRSGLAPTPQGPISEAEQFANYVLRMKTNEGFLWLTVRDRFTPFGYVPAKLRSQPGFLLVEGTPKITTSSGGSLDGLINDVTGTLRRTGSATLHVSRRYTGKQAIDVRRALDSLEQAQQRNAFEGLIAKDLPGAALTDLQVRDRDDLDKPLTIEMTVEVPDFTRRNSGALLLSPPFQEHLSKLATLPSRKTTLLLSEAYHAEVHATIKLPAGSSVTTELPPIDLTHHGASLRVHDRVVDGSLILDRVLDLPAERIKPADYPAFQEFCRDSDDAMQREIRIVPGK